MVWGVPLSGACMSCGAIRHYGFISRGLPSFMFLGMGGFGEVHCDSYRFFFLFTVFYIKSLGIEI